MIAYSCEPYSSSEGAVGWELASRIARRHHVTLLTRPKARADIERLRTEDPTMNLEVEYHELGMLRKAKRLGLPVSNLRYLVWNHRLSARVAELEATGRYDLVHHTTWVRHWMPSAASGASKIPFVWGPVGAAERPPLGLLATLGWRSLAGEALRRLGPSLLRLDPMMRRTLDRVRVAVASSEDTARYLGRKEIAHVVAPSVGYDPASIPTITERNNQIISAGRLLGWKGFHLGLRAFARLDEPDLRYTIVGEGPELGRLAELAARIGVADRVEFTGRLGRDETLARIGASRLLVHPSLHDSGGFVVVEALAQGVRVLSLDIGGPAFLAQSGGWPVPPRPTGTVVDRLAEAMGKLLAEDSSRSEAARRRASEALVWERIVDVYDDVYRRVAPGI
jgi:glycosyltransferase involved in cell wall biosynthesis